MKYSLCMPEDPLGGQSQWFSENHFAMNSFIIPSGELVMAQILLQRLQGERNTNCISN